MQMSFFAATSPDVYDYYFPSVKRGSCSVARTAGAMTLDAKPDFVPSSHVAVTLEGGTLATAEVQTKTGTTHYRFGGREGVGEYAVALYSPTQPALLPYVLNLYNLKKGGFQTLHVTDLATQKPRDLNVEFFRKELRVVGGRKLALNEWRLESPPTAEAVIWTDAANVPVYWWVPSQNYEIVRRGFEALRPATKFEGKVSPARFQSTVDKDVWIPMRDGVRLMADVYRPAKPGRYPVVLQRTCYDRSEFGNVDGEFYAQRGYVYVTQHVRGRGGSEGEFWPEVNEAADGFDTVNWCGTQPWSSGRVGMIGASYNAYCLWTAATTKPKFLKTAISVVPMPGPPDGSPWNHGAYYVGSLLNWYGLLKDRAKVQAFNDDQTASTNVLPIGRADSVQFGHEHPLSIRPRLQARQISMQTWPKSPTNASSKNIDMPVLYLDGWLDTVAVGTRINYLTMIKNGRANQKLVWGPWNHFTNRESRDGVTDFTPDGYIDMRSLTLRWFDRWLKLLPNGIDKEPAVDQYILGENKWHKSAVWPPVAVHRQKWDFKPGVALAAANPKVSAPSRYVYNPASYVYSNDHPNGFFFTKGGDASDLCARKGQLVFDSQALKRPMRLDGPIKAKLYASTDVKDTDWAMTLLDVHPDGVAVAIQTGFTRARFRKSFSKPTLLKPGEVFGYDLDLWQTGILIPTGHRLRIVVESTLFPDMDRNLNTGEPSATASRMLVAHQEIYHEPGRASYIELPVLRGSFDRA